MEEDDVKQMKERYAELLVQEMYDIIVEGVAERESTDDEWTIFAEIPDEVAEMLKNDGFKIEKDQLKFTVKWG